MNELVARTKLTKLISENPFIRGSMTKRKLTCGNPTCKCAKGKLHLAFYLGVRFMGKRRIIHVPTEWVPVIRQWLENYREIAVAMDVISESCITKLMKGKEKISQEN
jgi:hypothetical protein